MSLFQRSSFSTRPAYVQSYFHLQNYLDLEKKKDPTNLESKRVSMQVLKRLLNLQTYKPNQARVVYSLAETHISNLHKLSVEDPTVVG